MAAAQGRAGNFVQACDPPAVYISRMETMTQPQAVRAETLGSSDRVRFWRAERLDGLDGLAARFIRHRYAPHSHDTWAMGTITAGCEAFTCRGTRHHAVVGQVVVVPPGVVHDGEPGTADGYEYRMLYPSEGLVRALAADLFERGSPATPGFAAPVIADADLASRFALAHARLAEATDDMAGEELLAVAVAGLLLRHGRNTGTAPPRAGKEAAAVERARSLIDVRYAEPLSLGDLAAVAGLTRFRLIRAFAREVGLTPHLYLVDRRVRAARDLLRQGQAPAVAATLTGFADQSHMTRAFKARLGVTPAVFRRGGAAKDDGPL